MSELVKLEVKVRDTFGKRRIRRLRESGFIPACLYGHGQNPVNLSVATIALKNVLRHGHRILNLSGDGVSSEVLVKEVQWDTWGIEVLHVDFARIDANERITVTVPVVLKGEAAGLKEGGVVEQHVHDVEIECSAINMPESIIVRVGDLALDGSLSFNDVTLPEGVTIALAPETVIVSCYEKKEIDLEAEAIPGAAEPEVIARKKEEEAAE